MWRNFLIYLWILHLSYARREASSDRNDDDDLDIGADVDDNTQKAIRLPLTTPKTTKGEIVVEKFVDTLMASEKYLKMIETVEEKLTHLETTFQDRSSAILKYLAEVLRVVKTSPSDHILENALQLLKNDLDRLKETMQRQVPANPSYRAIQNQTPSDKLQMLDVMKSDIGQIRYMVEQQSSASKSNVVDNSECNLEGTLDTRLSFLESNLKSVLTSVEGITTVISEVKNRQRSQNLNKNDNNEISQIGKGIDVTALISEFRRAIQEQKARKCDCKIGRVDRSERYPTDCHEIQAQGFNITGIYKIKPEDIEPFYVLCDLSSAGGGWTVIQNRFDGTQDFLKNWAEYKHGFGNLAGEFWLGLEKVYYLTNQKLYELRIEMEGQKRQEASASYSVFTIGPEYEGYRISTLGTFRGSAGDSLSYHAGQKFSTYDMDNDEWKEGSCAVEHGGAWWYKECDKSNLNGKYVNSADESNGQSIYWISFKGPNSPLYKTRMMIRPLPASRPLDSTGKARALQDNSKRPKSDMKPRIKDPKIPYDMGRVRSPYRYDDNVQPDAFFPNYA
ncbi:fibrinogen C domain-containing protein 1-like isoform X1 [Maniola jurtina]|uniref:fibrinogen C domain-containing protein 1-like isoform X1 n=1 Tax=Maniola jurtina TaxID=191418 RepID=UPI001E68605D|nr:fibrinogen C domain-containing protein 1-like isoform X1 [Maniola jurtina]